MRRVEQDEGVRGGGRGAVAVRPGDWSALTLSGDPTPGDPDVLLRVASYMDVMAGHAQTADDGLATVLRQSGEGAFVGKTADWLREQISKEMSGFIAGVRTAFSAAGPAIRTYAEALREAQAKADQALRSAAGAGDDEDRINALKADAQNAAADVTAAAGTARQAILDATGHIRSPVTPKSACEVFWEIFTWLTLVITVVAIFVGGPLGLLAFAMNAALAVKATLDFAMGKTNALGLALGLLGLLGPSTRPLIALGDLTKLASSAWRNITQLSRNSFNLARTGINDFWQAVSALSIGGIMRGIGDLGVTVANSVKVGALMIPRIVGPLDGLAVRGFVALEKFTLVTTPAAITRLGVVGYQGLGRLAGLTADAGRFVAANAVRFGNLMAREFGGWKWLRIFLPLAGHEIGAVGVSGAFKLGVLGRGLGMTRFDALASLGGGVRLANGITTVHVVTPGGAPHTGGINVSQNGLYLPDLVEKPLIGGASMPELSFSARGVDLSATRGALGANDLAGLRGAQNLDVPVLRTADTVTPVAAPGLPGAAHAVDLGAIARPDVPTVNPAVTTSQVTVPTVGTPGSVTLPNMQIGNLSTTLNRVVGGVEGMEAFGRTELRHLHMGEVSAVRVSETGVAFNLGAPEKAFGETSTATPTPAPTGVTSQAAPTNLVRAEVVAPPPTHLGRAADASTVHQALNLLDGPGPGALTAPPRVDPSAVTTPTAPVRDISTPVPPRAEQTGGPSPQQLSHLHALDQLQRAQHALANASGDALTVARAEKDVRVAEALVRRTADGLRIEAREVSLAVDPPPAHPNGTVAPDLAAAREATSPDLAAARPAAAVDEAVQQLQTRLDDLRGADAPRTDLAALELEHRFAQLRPTAPADIADLPSVPTEQPGTSLAELESRLAALRGTDPPSPAARQLELEHRFHQLRPGAPPPARPVEPAIFPDVPTISPAEATARATAVERLTDLETQLAAARAEEVPVEFETGRLGDAGSRGDTPGRPETPDQAGTPAGAERASGAGAGDRLPDLPSVPRADPAAAPGPEALHQRLTELVSDARGVELPERELGVLSGEVRTAIEQGRHGDAARGLNALHDRIDRHALFPRLDSFRAHVDAGHHRAAQLGMEKSTWLQHAIDIERAVAAGETDELHRLLHAYENSLAGKLAEQKLHDRVVPDATPDRAPDGAGSAGDLAELQARLDALRGDHAPDPRLAGLELEQRFAALRGTDGPDVPLAELPDAPTLPPGGLDDLAQRLHALRGESTPEPDLLGMELRHRLDALRGSDNGAPRGSDDPEVPPTGPAELPDVPTLPPGSADELTERLGALRTYRDEAIGMPPAERAEWDAEFGRAGTEAAEADVLARYELRVAALEREARLAELRGGSGPLPADEYRAWQDALARAGDNRAGIDHVLSRYAARLDQHRLDTAAQINAALTSPDHLRPLDSRLDEALGGLSQSLRDSTAARYTTLGDRLAELRGADGPPVPGRAADDPPTLTTPVESPATPKPTESPATPKPTESPATPKPTESPATPKPTEGPARPTSTAGDDVLELPAPPRAADDASTAPAEKVAMPPRDLLGDGRPGGQARVIEVDAERWRPLKDAFRFEPPTATGQPPKVTRPPASGERVGVGYRLTVTEQEMHFALKLRLDAAPGVTAQEIATVKARVVEGLQRYVNAPEHRLPGWDVPMRVTVDFDDPANARGSVTVAPAGTQTSQRVWAANASPAAYAHEIVHQLGATDTTAPPNALLRGTHQPEHGDLMGSHTDGVDELVLTPAALGQIADVLAPYFSGSAAPRPVPDAVAGNVAEEFWASGVDVAPRVTTAEATPPAEATAPAPAGTVATSSGTAPAPLAPVVASSTIPTITVTPPGEEIAMTVLKPAEPADNPLPGLYRTRPDLLHVLDSINDLDGLIRDLDQSVTDAVRARVAEKLPLVPGSSKLSVQTGAIGQALRDDAQSFFTTGGRSFDVRDGLFGWHRVTVTPIWSPAGAQVIDQSADRAKFDTRSDQSAGIKYASTTGGSGSLGVGTMFPQRVGYGAGGAVDVALSRPLESFQDGAKLIDSHNVRSGSGSHLVTAPVGFQVTVTDPDSPLTGPQATERRVGEPVGADVTFRTVDDIANATPREPDWLTVDPSRHTSMLVENLTPVRILRAGIGLDDGADPTGTWNDVVEDALVMFRPTKTVGPGTLGAGQARGLFEESSMIGNLLPALDTAVHPPTITSTHGAHALSLEITATMPKLSVLADVAKTSFRWQPGQSEATQLSHSSRVGTGLSLVPARWAFGPGYVQARLFWGFLRSMTASATHGGTSRTGTEFKDIANVLVEAHFRVTVHAGLREVPGSRLSGQGTIAPITVDLVVLGHLPAVRVAQLLNDSSVLIPAPKQWYVPPYALGGGRSVTYGLSGFQQLYLDVSGLIRRIEGGFLPEYGRSGRVKRMRTSRAAVERQANQDALDRVLSVSGLRQGRGTLLKTGLVAELTRTKKIGTRHVIVHVTASYTRAFQHLGTSSGDAVRTSHADTFQEKINAGLQWRGAVAFEGGGVFRLVGTAASALVPAGAVELRGRFNRQSDARLAGQEIRLNGGTPNSQAFGNDLQITVQVYAYTKRLGPDPKSRSMFGRVMHQRLPRPVTDPAGTARVVNPTHEPAALVGGKQFTRFRLVQTRPVTVQFDNASVLARPISLPTTMTPRPDPLAVDRRTQLELTRLREWVDEGPKSTVNHWLSVEDFPGSTFITRLARDTLRAAQEYTDAVSRTKLGGLRGTDGLAEGMPVWAGTIDRLGESRQIHGLAAMLDGVWHVDRLTTAEDGAATDLAVAVALTNPTVLPAFATITNESASVGSVEVGAAKTVERQLALRANFSANVRRSGTSTETTSGGGVLFPFGYEKLLYAGSTRHTESVSGAIERNANNRKGSQRSFLVVFDMRVSVAAEITTEPDRYAAIPQSLRTGEWLHHHKSVARHGTISNAIFLRLSAATMVKLGLLPKLAGDPGTMGAPWLPTLPPALGLPPGRSPGLGLYTFDETPTLTESMTSVLRAEAANLGPDRGMVKGLLDMVQGRITNRSIGKISDSLSGPGLDDPMLNRRRLLHLFTPAGQAQHWSAMVDGGVSVLHMKPGRMTQHSRDVRLLAEPIGEPKVLGFVADHDDLDIKTTHTSEQGVTRQRTHGDTATVGVAGTGVSNHHGENLAVGMGDTVGRVSQVLNAQNDDSTTTDTNLSSGRGVKARLETRVKYTLAIFDKGERVDGDLLVVYDKVIQDRWADDLRPPRSAPADRPTPYQIVPPAELAPGWRTVNGMPLPPRFSAEDVNQVAQVQRVVTNLLAAAAKRLRTTGYAGAHQIHQSLTPEILLPAMSKLISAEGFTLPPAVSAQIFGQKAAITIRLLPEGASLGGVSSGVFREHARQQSGGYSTGTSIVTQHLRIPRIPLIGRGFADDPYQALETGGPGVAAGDTQAAAESGSNSTSDLGNVKPESRSAAVDYLSRVEVTVSLSYSTWPTRTVTSASQPTELVNVSLRMGLHDARTALHIPTEAAGIATDSPDRVAAFGEIVDHEAKLARAAENFVSSADKLDQARYDAYAAPEGSAARAEVEAKLPGLHQEWDRAGQTWWDLLQRHHGLLDDFRHRYLGVAEGAKDADAAALAKHIQDESVRLPTPPQPTTTPPAQQPATTAPVQQSSTQKPATAPPVQPSTTAAPKLSTEASRVLPTPGGGLCQLYAAVGSAPELVSTRLAAAGLGSPALHSWLADPEAVRAQITGRAAQTPGLMPPNIQIGTAAELLRRLVEQHLRAVGPEGVPAQAIEAYRNNRVLQLRAEVDAMDRDTLLGRLRDAGITRLHDPALLPAVQLRDLYIAQRTADLVAAGWDAAAARAHAEGQVPLRPTTDGSPPRDLADESLSMRAMFDYLTASGNPVGLQALPDGTLRDQLMTHLLDPLRPVDADEFAALVQAVRNWADHWHDAVGEAYPGLLAAALDAQIRIHAPEHSQTIGREGAPLFDVYRHSDHYQAMVEGQPAPPEPLPPSPPKAAEPKAAEPKAAELDETRGPAVDPKGVKPFEIDPPVTAGGKTVSGDALRTQQVRVNPAWMPLSDFTPEIHAGRPDARWHYVVTEGGDIMIGSEEILTVVSAKQLDDLHAAMRTKNPDLTLDQLRESINQQGHPTIGVRFDAEGHAYVGKGRISGELHRDPETGRWVVDDKSGRYMSEKIRPQLDPADVKRWLDNVAVVLSKQLGEPVEARPYKHTTAPPPTKTAPTQTAPTQTAPTQTAPTQTAKAAEPKAAEPKAAELDETRGPAVDPKGVKPFEIDPPVTAGGKTVSGDALRTQQVRVNPAWMPLSDFTPEIHAGRPDARWHYVVTEGGDIMIGSEEILTVVSAKQLDDLHAAMRTKNPDLTLDQLRESINQQGHPTIGVRFDAEGHAYVGKGRISGELHRDPETGRWVVDDKSGRYMSEKIRPQLDPADVKRWLDNVAVVLSKQLGEPVEARPYKHTTAPPPTKTAPTQTATIKPAEGTETAPPAVDLRARWVEFQAQRLRAEGTDPVAAGILASGLTADRDTMLADLATQHATQQAAQQATSAGPTTTDTADLAATSAPDTRTATTATATTATATTATATTATATTATATTATATATTTAQTTPPGHVAPPGPDYRILRSADAAHLRKLHDEVSQLVATKADDRGKLSVEVWREVAGLITSALGAPPIRAITGARPGLEGAFSMKHWIMELATDGPVDEVMQCLVHELAHLEQFSVAAQMLATRFGDPAAPGAVTAHPDVQRELWEGRVTDDPRYPAIQQIWDSHTDPATRHFNETFLQTKLLARDARQRLSVAERLFEFAPRALDRLRRGLNLLDALSRVAPLRYNTQPTEMQAFLTQLRYTSLGSVRDWSGTPVAQLAPPEGYELVGLGRAGGFLRPTGSATEPPQRLAHPDRPLLVISLADSARADELLTELRTRLPDRVLVELVIPTPVSAARAMELARLLGPEQRLAFAPHLIEPPGAGLSDHFVSYSRLHTATLPAFARYVTVHHTPRFPQLATPTTDLGNLGGGRWGVFGDDWQATSVGDRVWVGPKDATPVIEEGDPRVVIGTPGQDTPWPVWQHGMWLARMLAGQEGDPDAPIARVHRPETQPPPVRLDGDLVHAVTDQDAELARLVTGEQNPLAAYEYSFPTPYPPLEVVPGQDLSFTVYDLIDALLDVTDVPPAERDVTVLLDALTALAGKLGLTGPDALRNLLAAGYLAARAYGIGGFGLHRLTAAYRALRLLEPTAPLASGPSAAADLIAWVDGANVDTWAPDLPVRLMQVLERTREQNVGLAQLTAANQADAERIRLALDGLVRLDTDVWATAGVGPQVGSLPAEGDLVLAYPAGPRLQPVPPSSAPAGPDDPLPAALLAFLGDQARTRVNPDGGREMRVRLVPVTDTPVTRDDFHYLRDDLADLNDRLGWRVVLGDPVRSDGSPVQFIDPAPEPPAA
ncbi:hypothetical protein ACN28C_32515 [Plantactinospora sp. WMMC1484]|uniref:hypothetical protein n=1 Tax=Plantactinospora sp. WMMC1484 TaxID=3404122 RepID=UPI003BF4A83A